MELLPGDRLGKYEIVGRLAAGGMAEVYLAMVLGHGGFAKPIALKRMLPSHAAEPGFREMFMREASVAARLNHPHIVQIFDFAEESGELYLAMEFVPGVNLKILLADSLTRFSTDGQPLRIPPLLAAHICRCVAQALSYAWNVPNEHGQASLLVHRDVSPHNILVSYEGGTKLADFGIARPANLQTSAGVLKGKLCYMAPEQLADQHLDARTDIHALGIVLYEAALGLHKPLFYRDSTESIQLAIRAREVISPIRINPHFPLSLSEIIMTALEREPANRFQSASEFADALGECIHREAKSPLDYDLPSFMRRLYGDPPPIKGLPSSGSWSVSVESNPSSASVEKTMAMPREQAIGEPLPNVTQLDKLASIAAQHNSTRKRLVFGAATVLIALLCVTAFFWKSWNTIPFFGDFFPKVPVGNGPSTKKADVIKNNTVNNNKSTAIVLPKQLEKKPGDQNGPVPPKIETPVIETPVIETPVIETPADDSNRRAPPRSVGWLLVDFKPMSWGYIWVDGKKDRKEATPRVKLPLSPGKHRLHISDEYGTQYHLSVTIYSGKTRSIQVANLRRRRQK